QPQVELGDRPAGQDRLAAPAGVAGDQAPDVDRRPRRAAFPGLLSGQFAAPRSRVSCQVMSPTHFLTPRIRRSFSELRVAADWAISSFSRAVSGRTCSNQPSMAGVLPSAETRLCSASTRRQAGL